MESSVHIQKASKLRNNHKKNIVIHVSSFTQIGAYSLQIYFTDGTNRVINFEKVFKQLQGYYAKWYSTTNFKKVFIEHGNLQWGKNADVIFSFDSIYTGAIENAKIA